MFDDQFDLAGDGYIYRRNQKAAPIQVTATERDRFVRQFRRRLRVVYWGLLAGMMAAFSVEIAASLALGFDLPGWAAYVTVGVIGTAYLVLWRVIWNAPARALRRRPTVGTPRSTRLVRERSLRRVSWRDLGIAILGVLTLIGRGVYSPNSQWAWAWIAFGGALLIALVIQGVRKALMSPRD